jgi:outer membrane receptor protein involved in Fe transport
MMGVINIITRENVNSVEVAAGSFNRKKVNFFYSKEIEALKLDVFIQSQQDDGEGYVLNDTFSASQIETDDPRTVEDFIFKMKFHNTSLNMQQHQFESSNFYELDGISNDFNERNGSIASIGVKQDFFWGDVQSWLQVDYRQTNVELAGQLTPVGLLAGSSDPSSNDALFVVAKFDRYAETHVQWHNSFSPMYWPNSNVQFGFEYRYVDAPGTQAQNNFDIGDLATGSPTISYYGELLETTVVQDKSSRNITGQYLQLQHDFTAVTQFTFGLRHDDFNDLGSQLTPRLGMVHGVTDHHQLKVLYGEAYRVPSESEMFLKNNPVLLGNPDLKPETVQTVDIIWMGHWFNRAFTLGYFENHFTDAIIQTPSDLGIPKFENVDQDPSKGFELEYSQQLNDAFLVKASYTHITDKPDINFREAAKLGSMTVNFQHYEYNANIVATWHDERELAALDTQANRIKLADNWVWFAKLSVQHSETLRSYLQIKNISDKQYNSPALGAALTDGVANRGREILLGINWTFD